MKNNKMFVNIGVLVLVAVLCFLAGKDFKAMHTPDHISRRNPGITEVRMLSDYSPGLKDTAADVEIYVFDSGKPGGSMLILGGTHPNETAGLLNTVLWIENVTCEEGTLYVIPRANSLGFTATAPMRGDQDFFVYTLDDGTQRTFRNGNRHSNAAFQWPDANYHDGNTGRVLVNNEVPENRNLNRNHTGRIDGNLTEKMCYGIYNLILTDEIDVLYDAHEAGLRFPRINYLIAHERAMPLGSMAIMNNVIDGHPFAIDLSGATSYGLSHRSLGDNTNTYATLFETLNPAQGTLHGKVTWDLVMNGIDPINVELTKRGAYDGMLGLTEAGSPMEQRTGYHMVMCQQLAVALTDLYPDKPLVLSGMPSYDDLVEKGFGHYLQPVQ